MDRGFWGEVASRAEEIFLRPGHLLAWDAIVEGAVVCAADGSAKRMEAVAKNTWRAHHRIDKAREGSGAAYKAHFVVRKRDLLERLRSASHRDDLHRLANDVVDELRPRLGNMNPHVRSSYNSLRKPVDLYLEHLVAMAREVDAATRARVVPWLRLPLDSQMLGTFALPGAPDWAIFQSGELRRLSLTRASSYGHIRTEETYLALGAIVDARAREVGTLSGRPFHPVYFDMLWNERYRRGGRNLFETNP